MKKILPAIACLVLTLTACNNNPEPDRSADGADSSAVDNTSVNPGNDWKFGIALWTFHTVNFPRIPGES